MNQSIHQLLQLILQGISWVLRMIEALWVWSSSQIVHAFDMSWWSSPPWKIVVGLIFVAVLARVLLQLFWRSLAAFEKIATAPWTMTLTLFGVVTSIAGVFSRGFQMGGHHHSRQVLGKLLVND